MKIDSLHFLISDINHSRRKNISGIHAAFNKLECSFSLKTCYQDDRFKWTFNRIKIRIANIIGSFLKDKVVNYFR